MLSTGEGQANRTTTENTGNQYEDLQQQQTNRDQLDQEFDYNQQHSTSHHFNFTDHENSSFNIRVQQLHQHFQAEHVKKKRLLEEKHWAEVYDSMFSSFKQCAVKTADWGDEDKWRQDWKDRCSCLDKRSRPLVLVDILSRRQIDVEFCDCQVDQVRLIQMGYIGTSPKFPRTAFSIRLLRLHDIIWKNCAVSITPFAKAIDEYLDANNPLILVSGADMDSDPLYTTRDWRKTLSTSVDVYREMLRREKIISKEILQMDPMDKMADICPKCYGPCVSGKKPDEPDYIVCMDGNFQHRRHLAASHEISQSSQHNPLFISPEEVKDMETRMNTVNHQADHGDVSLDRCTEQHTAANDSHGATTWKACDDTGLFGLACRHDQILRLINIVQSGENEERQCNQLMFGTSVFHAYVHQWSCQLRYNPRLNNGWGMSDGEGLERIWAYLSPLISSLRYSTKKHRLTALDMRSSHHNEVGKSRSVKLLFERGKNVEELFIKSMEKLKEIEDQHGYTSEYLTQQWLRQRECQLSAMENDSEREMIEYAEQLVEVEDELQETQDELVSLRAKRRRTRTEEDQEKLRLLPNTVIQLEEHIEMLVEVLGSEAFRNLPGNSNADARALIRLKISKSKLYEAKARFKKLMSSKMKHLKIKWTSYDKKANHYNENYSTDFMVETPVYEEVKSMGLDDVFWNMGSLLHPNEPWAFDPNVKDGIEAILTSTHCKDELHRISREARQAISWAIKKSDCLDNLSKLLSQDPETNILNPNGQQLLNNICSKHHFPREVLDQKYIDEVQDDVNLKEKWTGVILACQSIWEKLVVGSSVIFDFGNVEDQQEEILQPEDVEYQINEEL
ncbi:uncharacterized protein PGTG_11894 [Puccinia graminis f. sp. tritici CRL 75-36-700-3]|uniref:CxC1-like cysteine cluster associated with KDZ transposases domain-containing protein n=1 Tax=Puccinia graminis f. sp. tritici (strain CRL 75-36-700-3 / race SCCL) TaxID=418459 RepID=E3KML3_PUCGT|nr:uncharacterized protein PGTG_11894 [Puccinia graminis f. sp. tritici CRL 75-36-700-3]EFP85538.2 hypothetical protein PGTG_11894 [Puccinia graminis f. sp. tritici CRL 75-36-700-3]